jgi:hypothetical protein
VLVVVSFFNHSSGRRKVAQKSVQWICGILRDLQAFFWLRVFSALGHFPSPPANLERKPLGWLSILRNNMKTNGSNNYLSYPRILRQIGISTALLLTGAIAGILAGILSNALAVFFFWIYRQYAFPANMHEPLSQFIHSEILAVGFPLGLRVGLSMGLLLAIFRMNTLRSWIWVIISALGTIFGYLLSGFDPWTDRIAVFLEVVFTGTMTGWISFELLRIITRRVFDPDKKPIKPTLIIICSICGILLIFISVYSLWLNIRNVPS